MDIGINRTIVAHFRRSALNVIEEVHPVITAMQVSQPLAIQDVAGFYAVYDLRYTQAVVVILILDSHAILRHLGELAAGRPGVVDDIPKGLSQFKMVLEVYASPPLPFCNGGRKVLL